MARIRLRPLVAVIALLTTSVSVASATPVAAQGGAAIFGQPLVRPAAAPVDWPHFRFNARHTGVNTEETVIGRDNVGSLAGAWQGLLGGEDSFVYYSSPAVVNGIVYIGTDDGHLFAFPAGGCGQFYCPTPLWESTYLPQIIDSPTVWHGKVYVGSQTSYTSAAGKLDVFAADGCGQSMCAPLWQGVAGTQSILESSPTIADGVVYIGSYDGSLYAFDARGCGKPKCQPLWTGQTGGTIESTPTVADGQVLVGSNDKNLYAFPAGGCGESTCDPLWTGDIGDGAETSTPAVAHGRIYISGDSEVAAFPVGGCGQSTCDPLWRDEYEQAGGSPYFGGSPAIRGDQLFIGYEPDLAVFDANGCGASICAPEYIDAGGGESSGIESSPTVANGVVYVGRNSGQVLAWSTKPCGSFSCSPLWVQMLNDQIVNSSPTVVDGSLYIGGGDYSDGVLYVFKPTQ